jgi:hypothetical protein
MKAKASKDERRQAAASYIINFFNEVQALNHVYGQYVNLLLEFKEKHGSVPEGRSLADDEKQTLSVLAQTVRHYCHKIYIGYKSFVVAKEFLENPDIDQYYSKVKNTYVIKTEDLEKFVVAVNALLVNDVVKDLLVSSHDIVNEIYQNE